MVILNKNTVPAVFNTERFAEMMKNKKEATDVLTGEHLTLGKELTVAPKSAMIMELK